MIDHSQVINGPMDLAVANGAISQVALDISPDPDTHVIGAWEKPVMQEFIDLRTHVNPASALDTQDTEGDCHHRR